MESSGNRLRLRIDAGLLASLVAIAVAAAGCGGAGKTQPQASAPPSHSTSPSPKGPNAASGLIPAADAICKQLNAKLASDPTAPSDDGQLARSTNRHLALERAVVLELAKLTPPASLAQSWKQILGYRRALAEELRMLIRYAEAHNAKGMQALKASKLRLHRELSKAASRSGFKDCALVGPGRLTSPSVRPR